MRPMPCWYHSCNSVNCCAFPCVDIHTTQIWAPAKLCHFLTWFWLQCMGDLLVLRAADDEAQVREGC
jgi:hypothetical protein